MQTSQRVYLRRDGKRGHEEIMIHVDWDRLTDADIRQLAAFYVLHRVEKELKGFDNCLPEAITYHASDFLHNEPMVQKELVIPESWREPPKSKARKELEKLMDGLTPEEIAALLA